MLIRQPFLFFDISILFDEISRMKLQHKIFNRVLCTMSIGGLLLLVSSKSFSQGFELSFGGPGSQVCYDITLSTDSTIYMLGYDSQGPLGGNDFILSKVTLSGQLLWSRHLGTSGDDFGYSVIYRSSSKLVLAGTFIDSIMGSQAMIIVTDTSGTETARYSYGTIETESICDANLTPDSGFVLCGYQSVNGTNYTYVLKIDSLFNEEWSVSYGAGINDYANESIMTDDSTCFVAGDRRIHIGGGVYEFDNCLFRLDGYGQLIWDSVYTAPFQNGGQGLIQDKSGNIVFFGETEIYQFSPFDYFLSAVNPSGQLLWSYTFGGVGTNALFDVVQDTSGFYIGTGYGNSLSNGIDPLNLSLIKIDSLGNLAWHREYGNTGIDIGYTILEAPDGGYLVGGRITTADGDDFYLIKTDWNGLVGIGEEIASTDTQLSLYPNPCRNELIIASQTPFYNPVIFDAFGRKIYDSPGDLDPVYQKKIDVQFFTPGMYFTEIQMAGNKVIRKSFLKY